MSKYQQCYYVMTFGMSEPVVKGITDAGFLAGFDVHKGAVGFVVTKYHECKSLKDAKKKQHEEGGNTLILKGMREIV